MKNPELNDLYSNYLLTSVGLSLAVVMSKMVDGQYSHDQIRRFLTQIPLHQFIFGKPSNTLSDV
jgi:hypothetical protein